MSSTMSGYSPITNILFFQNSVAKTGSAEPFKPFKLEILQTPVVQLTNICLRRCQVILL